MQERARYELAVGTVFILGLALLGGFAYFANYYGRITSTDTYILDFDDVAGLERGADVLLAGTRVGEVVSVDSRILTSLIESDFIPVIAPVGAGKEGETYNINADWVASYIASALNARKLILVTDTQGVLDKDGKLISTLNMEAVHQKIADGTIKGGMIPKVNCCMKALDAGVKKAHIIDDRQKHSILLEILTKGGIGTEIVH